MGLPSRDELDPDARRIYDAPGNVMAFNITRKRVQTGLTFSSEAFEGFLQSINTWLGTRLMRHWEETGEPPTIMNVMVAVGIDHGEPEEVNVGKVDQSLLTQAIEAAEQAVTSLEQLAPRWSNDKGYHAQVCEALRDKIDEVKARADGKHTLTTEIERPEGEG